MPIKKSASWLLAAAWLGLSFQALASTEESISKKLDAHLQTYVSKGDFRGAVLVAKDGKVLHRAAYGYADESNKRPNKVDTQFLLGSLTKSFTAVTVMQLVDEGKLDLHVPLSRYIPKLRKDLGQGLTLHLLLKHQSGLPVHLERLAGYKEEDGKDFSSAEVLQLINTSRTSFTPGARYEYSNLNYHLAALAIETVTGTSYATVLQERTFGPLKMSSSGIERLSNVPPRRAHGYAKGLFGVSRDENNVSYALGSGDIFSTVDDLLTWDRALFGTGLLSEKSQKQLFAGENSARGNYGYGFRIQEYQRAPQAKGRGTLVRHGGSLDGFLSNFHHYSDDNLTVIVLANVRPTPIRELTFELKEIALGVEAGSRPRAGQDE